MTSAEAEILAELRLLRRRVEQLERKTAPAADRLRAREVVDLYGISRSHLYRLSDPKRHRRPPITRVELADGSTRFDRASIERYLAGVPVERDERRGRPSRNNLKTSLEIS